MKVLNLNCENAGYGLPLLKRCSDIISFNKKLKMKNDNKKKFPVRVLILCGNQDILHS